MAKAINKVVYDGDTLIDLTDLTVDTDKLLSGIKAIKADGTKIIGTLVPSGGGGITEIAKGTVVGSNTYTISLPVGTSMAKTNFIVLLEAPTNSEFAYDTKYKFINQAVIVDENLAYYDLSSDGTKKAIGKKTFTINNNGTITTVTAQAALGSGQVIRNNSINTNAGVSTNSVAIVRSSSGFSLSIGQGNVAYQYPSTITYSYRILYYGDDPSNDIISI